jgi:hypothetical protein
MRSHVSRIAVAARAGDGSADGRAQHRRVEQERTLGSLDPGGAGIWQCPPSRTEGQTYRLCENYARENICNWAVPAADLDPLCRSCRLTRVIPDLSHPGHREAWYRLEVAKRRLVYNLLGLGLPLKNKVDDALHGLAFEFLADSRVPGTAPVLTGHKSGVITISVVEADDTQREKRRLQLHEPYRTLLGHFRHEIGHYYWDQLIQNGDRINVFRQLFGDERNNYQQALRQHYERGAPEDWQQRFVSAYASSHPWEDWAERGPHYLLMADALETAAACGLSLRPGRPDEPSLQPDGYGTAVKPFDRMTNDWFPLTYALTNLNRSLGLPDGSPFALSSVAIDKRRFVHEAIDRRQ